MEKDIYLNSSITSERNRLVSSMKGCHVVIPDMQAILRHWPQGVHPDLGKLEEDVHGTLNKFVKFY